MCWSERRNTSASVTSLADSVSWPQSWIIISEIWRVNTSSSTTKIIAMRTHPSVTSKVAAVRAPAAHGNPSPSDFYWCTSRNSYREQRFQKIYKFFFKCQCPKEIIYQYQWLMPDRAAVSAGAKKKKD